MKNKFFQIIGLITIIVFVTLACDSDGGGTPIGAATLPPEIDSRLIGTWKDNIGGTTLTVTFSNTGRGIVWSGQLGEGINSTVDSSFDTLGGNTPWGWIAEDGDIFTKYLYNESLMNGPIYIYYYSMTPPINPVQFTLTVISPLLGTINITMVKVSP